MSVRREKRKNRDGSYRERWMIHIVQVNPKGEEITVRKTAALQSKREADREEREIRAAITNGTYIPKKDRKEMPTLKEFENEFIDCHAESNNKQSYVGSERSIFRNHLIPDFGHLRLSEIRKRHIEKFKAQKLKKLKPATVNNLLTVLRKTLAVAKDWEIITDFPKFDFLKVPPQKFDFLEFEELDQLIEGAEPKWKPLCIVAGNTGLRLGEVLALKWKHVDLKRRLIRVEEAISKGKLTTPKNGKSRVIELNKNAYNALKQHRKMNQFKSVYVFCDDKGDRLTEGKLRWPLWRACDAANLRRIRMHVLRHTFASHLAMRGRPVNEIKELMGHASIKTTERYMHLSPNSRRAAVDSLVTSGNTTAIRGSEIL